MDNQETLVTFGAQDTGRRQTKPTNTTQKTKGIGTQTLEKTKGKIKSGQSRDNGNIGCTRHRTKTNKTKKQHIFM